MDVRCAAEEATFVAKLKPLLPRWPEGILDLRALPPQPSARAYRLLQVRV